MQLAAGRAELRPGFASQLARAPTLSNCTSPRPGGSCVQHAASAALSLPARRGFRGAATPSRQEITWACRFGRLWARHRCLTAPPPRRLTASPLWRRAASQWRAWRCAAEAPRADRSVDIEHSPDAEGSPWKMGYQVGWARGGCRSVASLPRLPRSVGTCCTHKPGVTPHPLRFSPHIPPADE